MRRQGGVSGSRQGMTALSAKRMGRLQSPVIFIAVAGRIITMAKSTLACECSLGQADAASRPTGGVSTIKSRKKIWPFRVWHGTGVLPSASLASNPLSLEGEGGGEGENQAHAAIRPPPWPSPRVQPGGGEGIVVCDGF